MRSGRSTQSPPLYRSPAAALLGVCLGLTFLTAAVVLRVARRGPQQSRTFAVCATAGEKPATEVATAVPSPRRLARTVLLSGCPASVSTVELQQQFPTAVEVDLLSPDTSTPTPALTTYRLVFPTAAKAKALLAQCNVQVAGNPVILVLASANGATETSALSANGATETSTGKVKPTVVSKRAASPAPISPKAKSKQRAFAVDADGPPNSGEGGVPAAIVSGSPPEVATAAPSPRKLARTVLLSGCPASVSTAELQQLFPTAVEVDLLSPDTSTPFPALSTHRLVFPTAAKAKALLAQCNVQVAGNPVILVLASANGATETSTLLADGATETSSLSANNAIETSTRKVKPKVVSKRAASPAPKSPKAKSKQRAIAVDADEPPDSGEGGVPAAMVSGAQQSLTPDNVALWADRARTLVLSGCPPTVSADQLQQLFPSAEEVSRLPPARPSIPGQTLHYRVVFPTVAEAEELAQWGSLQLAGQPVSAVLATDIDGADHQPKHVAVSDGSPSLLAPKSEDGRGPTDAALLASTAAPGAKPEPAAQETKGAKSKPKLGAPNRNKSPSKLKSGDEVAVPTPQGTDTNSAALGTNGAEEKPQPGQVDRSPSPVRPKPKPKPEAAKIEVPADQPTVSSGSGPTAVAQGGAAPEGRGGPRTVLLAGCPKTTSEAELRALFPAAEALTLLPRWPGGPFSGAGLLHFPTAAEAAAAAGRQGLKVKGQPVFTALAGISNDKVKVEEIRSPAALTSQGTPAEVLGEPSAEAATGGGGPSSTPMPAKAGPKAKPEKTPPDHTPLPATPQPEQEKLLRRPTWPPQQLTPGQDLHGSSRKARQGQDSAAQRAQSDSEQKKLLKRPIWPPQKPTPGPDPPDPSRRARQIQDSVAQSAQSDSESKAPNTSPKGSRTASGGEESKEKERDPWDLRTVVVSGCPPSTSKDTVQRQFPTATAVALLPKWPGGPFSGNCFVTFPTAAEAAAAASQQGLTVKGQPVSQLLGGKEAMEGSIAKQVLLSGCPLATTEEDVHRYFPNVTAIHKLTKWRGGPFNRRCILYFPNAAEAEAAANLKVLTAMGPDVQLSLVDRDTFAAERANRMVILSGCPPSATLEDVDALFPNVEAIVMFKLVSGLFSGRFSLRFPTAAEALEALARPGLTMKGQAVVAYMEDDEAAALEDRKRRTVVLHGCPASTTPKELRTQFPAASIVWQPPNPKQGLTDRYLLTFPSVAEAEAVAHQEQLIVKGTAVQKRMQVRKSSKNQPPEKGKGAPASMLLDDAPQGFSPDVLLAGCPTSTTEADLRALFPTVAAVTMLPKWPGGPFSGRCFLRFPTAAENEAVAAMKGLEVNGQLVQIGLANKAEFAQEVDSRTVVLTGCPPSTTELELDALFPAAEGITLHRKWPDGPLNGRCSVRFPTALEAEAAVSQSGLTLNGQPILIRMSADRAAYDKEKDTREVSLAGCPATTTEADVHALFPTMETVTMLPKWPGGPFSGRCLVRFPTAAEAQGVVAQPGWTLQGQPVWLQHRGSQPVAEDDRQGRIVFVSGCPPSVTEPELGALFPAAEGIKLHRKWPGGPLNGRCSVRFPTASEALAAVSQSGLTLNGQPILIRMPADKAAYEEEKDTRGVCLSGCPATTTEADVHALFPTMETITMPSKWPGGPFSGRCVVWFPTAAEAEEAAGKTGWTLQGQRVSIARTVSSGAAEEDQRKRTVVLSGCPPSITREELNTQFPRSEVIEVAPTRPGSFGRRRCYIVFPTVAEAVAVANQDGLTVMGELVERGMPGKKKLNRDCEFVLSGCPPLTTAEELRGLVPTASTVLQLSGKEADGVSFKLCFRTLAEAGVVAQQLRTVNGRTVTLKPSAAGAVPSAAGKWNNRASSPGEPSDRSALPPVTSE